MPVIDAAPARFTGTQPGTRLTGWLGRYIDQADRRHARDPRPPETYLAWLAQTDRAEKWQAEHIGKWLETAVLVWRRTGDAALRTLLDRTVERLIARQDASGHLGNYPPGRRFHEMDWNTAPVAGKLPARFDLWNNLLACTGLLDHAEATGASSSLAAARRIADLVIAVFGEERQDILRVMHNRGQGPLTALLPLARLWRLTADPRYGEFCSYLLHQFGRPHSLPLRLVNDPAAAPEVVLVHEPQRIQDDGVKHCELGLTLRALVELHRLTGDPRLLATSTATARRMFAPILDTLPVTGFEHPGVTVPVVHHRAPVETCDLPPMLRWWAEAFRQDGDVAHLAAIERAGPLKVRSSHSPDSVFRLDLDMAVRGVRSHACLPPPRSACR